MNLKDLIEEYKTLTRLCDNMDHGDKKAVKKNNTSVDRMYKIVEIVKDNFGEEGIGKLKELLGIQEYKTNLWIATHLLEKVEVDKKTELKSLEIIKRISATDELLKLGYGHWLLDYETRRGT